MTEVEREHLSLGDMSRRLKGPGLIDTQLAHPHAQQPHLAIQVNAIQARAGPGEDSRAGVCGHGQCPDSGTGLEIGKTQLDSHRAPAPARCTELFGHPFRQARQGPQQGLPVPDISLKRDFPAM